MIALKNTRTSVNVYSRHGNLATFTRVPAFVRLVGKRLIVWKDIRKQAVGMLMQ